MSETKLMVIIKQHYEVISSPSRKWGRFSDKYAGRQVALIRFKGVKINLKKEEVKLKTA